MKDAKEEEADRYFGKRYQGFVDKDESKEVLLHYARLECNIQRRVRRGTDLICYGDVALWAYIPYIHSKAIMHHCFR